MLPKPEKNKKQPKVQQLDLVETVSSEDKIKQKRKYLLVTICLTIGLSLVFWSYTVIKNFIASPKLPALSVSIPKIGPTNDVASKLKQELGTITPGTLIDYHIEWLPDRRVVMTTDNFPLSSEDQVLTLGQLKSKNTKSTFPDYLPEEISLKTTSQVIGEGREIRSFLIELPQKQLFISMSFDPSKVTASSLTQIIKTVYWAVVTND